MPFKKDPKILGSSKEMAWRRLTALWNKLSKNKELCELYKSFMEEYIQLGHMSLVEEKIEPETAYYIPHISIYRPQASTTKLRVVFNASAPSSNGISLNSLQYNGGIDQDDIFSIMSRFRKHRVAMTADITKMYRAILIDPSQRDLQRILWKTSPSDKAQEYRLNTLSYGTVSAPYLSTRTLKQLALDEGDKYPLAASVVLTDFYMDDLVSGVPDVNSAIELQTQLIKLLNAGGMTLHKWSSNEKCLLENVPYEDQEFHFDKDTKNIKTLGCIWDPKTDTLGFSVNYEIDTSVCTKRSVLSKIARLYDPCGILSPVIVKAKVFMQQLWLLKLDWDQTLPENKINEWHKFVNSLPLIENIKIKRHIFGDNNAEIEMHGFADASKDAYGAAVYIRCISTSGDITVNLLCSKSRVSPLKTISIPRLELCAAELLSKLVNKLITAMKLSYSKVVLWSDSTIVLAWIKTDPNCLKQFCANRVTKIINLTSNYQWMHVDTKENPADLVSRGLAAEKLLGCALWWYGPPMLHQAVLQSCDVKYKGEGVTSCDVGWTIESDDKTDYYNGELPDEGDYRQELKPNSLRAMTIVGDNGFLNNLLQITNNYIKLIHVLSFIFRFIAHCKKPSEKNLGILTSAEMEKAEIYIIKSVQKKHFGVEVRSLARGECVPFSSKLKCLNSFLDANELIRVGGRLVNSSLSFDHKFPIVLPKESKLTLMIIEHYHIKNLHAGTQTLLYAVRQRFWPLNGRDLARRVVHKCVLCFRQKPKAYGQIMGELPSERVNPTSPFNISGVDFCGAFYIKVSNQRRAKLTKVYLSIFICFATKAIHIEAVTDLTSEAFIACLKRFFSRRGKISVLYSDNCKNFVGANAELKRLFTLVQSPDQQLGGFLTSEKVSWRFIPPRTPNQGGLWENGVKSVKYYLKRTMGNANLTYEEFLTVVIQIEGIINSRPICPLSSDPNDLQALTPGHFLIGRPINALPEPQLLDIKDGRLSRWQLTTKIVQSIWHRWEKNYLTNLQQRNKWMYKKDNIKKDDLVVIIEENIPPGKWVLGRIIEPIYGADGYVRVLRIKTSTGIVKRGANRVCVMPIENEMSTDARK